MHKMTIYYVSKVKTFEIIIDFSQNFKILSKIFFVKNNEYYSFIINHFDYTILLYRVNFFCVEMSFHLGRKLHAHSI